jgi:hypothetical protein
MAESKSIKVADISLDLSNPRTIPQPDEPTALDTMITINPTKFWGLMKSIIDDGYHPTENIILLKDKKNKLTVKEGNRRIAILKILLGKLKHQDIPSDLTDKITANINTAWKKQNAEVPCMIYEESEAEIINRIVSLIHAKGEPARRDEWPAVAKSRYDRDKKGISSPALDLLEAYLKNGKNINKKQSERWSGDYPITVLQEALPKIGRALNQIPSNFIKAYPQKKRNLLDSILLDIGYGQIGFKEVRDITHFFGEKYGLSLPETKPKKIPYPHESPSTNPGDGSHNDGQNENNGSHGKPATQPPKKDKSLSSHDPRSVSKKLKAFTPLGNNREKLVTLLTELKTLKIEVYPHAFCFLLRSLFEISAKIYCQENEKANIKFLQNDEKDKPLVNLLKEITKYLTQNDTNKTKMKELHGALAELAKKDGLLSVTSMNQLVHNKNFSVIPSDICILFHNIFPLLEEMNT